MQTYKTIKSPSSSNPNMSGFRSKISSVCNGIGLALAMALISPTKVDAVESTPTVELAGVLEVANAFNLPSGQNVPQYVLNSISATASLQDYGMSISHIALSNPDLISLYRNAFVIEAFVQDIGFVNKLSVAYDDFFEVFRANIDYKNLQLTGLHALEGFQNIKFSGNFPIGQEFAVDGSAKLVSRTQGKDVIGSVNLGYAFPLGKSFNLGTSLGVILNGENADTLKRETVQPLVLVFFGFQR
mgnify:FL=1